MPGMPAPPSRCSRDFFEWDQDGVRIKASTELTPDQTAVVVEVQETRSKGTGKNTIKIKLSDKQAALEKLGRHLGMFKAWPPFGHVQGNEQS
jgi:phage terminase small subunit